MAAEALHAGQRCEGVLGTLEQGRRGDVAEVVRREVGQQRLVRIMKEAFTGIWQVAQEHKVSLRTATFIVACRRILLARDLRGLYP